MIKCPCFRLGESWAIAKLENLVAGNAGVVAAGKLSGKSGDAATT